LYDDGGYSGGTLDRPALQRLLADIADAKVDVVVVYKIDRLTRSLFDFAKIVEAFDARGVSFVSITQQFNTTTSMGRLTLNVLLSFAQFEREVAGERIRDKIAASKKKGMWMGGLPPLGYDVRDRRLVVKEGEAQTVLHIFRRYIELRSVRALKVELDAAGIRSKQRTFADGTVYGGHKLSRGALYLMLQNRIYRGEITHKGNAYPGEHKAIVDEALWDKVQAVLAENRVDRTTGADAKYPSLLAGLAFDDSGERLTPTHAVKKGTRYRYYVSRSLITGTAKDHSQGRRIPAGNLENLVIGRLRAFLADEGAMLSAISDAEENGAEQNRLIARGRQISGEFPTLTPDAIRSILMTLVSRIDIKAEHVEIRVYRQRLHDLLQAGSLEPCLADPAPASHPGEILKLKVKARLQRIGREMKLIVHNADDRAAADPGLLRIVARAHDFQERLIQDPDLTVPAIASQERLTIGYLSRLLRLPSLAPDIVTAIINGKHPSELSAKRLMRLALKLPTDWAGQRKLLGFGANKAP
jgi:site-specific DNA recombinase